MSPGQKATRGLPKHRSRGELDPLTPVPERQVQMAADLRWLDLMHFRLYDEVKVVRIQ